MTGSEMTDFNDVFRDVWRHFPKRLDEDEKRKLSSDYFAALRRFSLTQVTAGASVFIERGKYFPKVAEWIDAIPKHRPHAELSALSTQEASDWLDAERRHWEGEPCKCGPCRQAGVDHRFTRFVPLEDTDGNISKARIGDREITRGRWIHGDELQRWYQARDHFYELKAKFFPKRAPRGGGFTKLAGGE